MQAQIDEGYEYFLVQRQLRKWQVVRHRLLRRAGATRKSGLFLSKFYLQHAARGSGTGRRCMEFIEGLARRRGLSSLWLTVNKGNPAVQAYQRLGFRIAADLVMDIGGGFVMDDYRMEKALDWQLKPAAIPVEPVKRRSETGDRCRSAADTDTLSRAGTPNPLGIEPRATIA